ncbi:hypothetical protein AAG906_004730 [Vitis piasezkii]
MTTFMKDGRLYLSGINKYNTKVGNKEHVHWTGMSYADFVSNACERLDINSNVYTFHYTLEFDPSALQYYDYARIYVLKRARRVEVEGSIVNVQNDYCTEETHNSITSCQPNIESNLGLSQGFISRCAETEVRSHDLSLCPQPIIGNGHSFPNVDEFRNALYTMSLVSRFQYKFKKNSPKRISMCCSVDGCPWKITTNSVGTTKILKDNIFNNVHNHCVDVELIRATPQYLPRQICKDFRSWHGVSLNYKQRIYGLPENAYMLLPWLCQRLVNINLETIAECTRQNRNFRQLFIAQSFSIQGFLMGSLFFATDYDVDDDMFSIAFGVKLKGILQDKKVVIISNGHQAILHSISQLFGVENHAYCYRHVKENFSSYVTKHSMKGQRSKEDALLLLDSVVYVRLDDDYVVSMEKLKTYNNDLVKKVEENSPQH